MTTSAASSPVIQAGAEQSSDNIQLTSMGIFTTLVGSKDQVLEDVVDPASA